MRNIECNDLLQSLSKVYRDDGNVGVVGSAIWLVEPDPCCDHAVVDVWRTFCKETMDLQKTMYYASLSKHMV
jgi:hypothetical protein